MTVVTEKWVARCLPRTWEPSPLHKCSSLISLLLVALNSNYLRPPVIKDTFPINQYDDEGKLHVWFRKIWVYRYTGFLTFRIQLLSKSKADDE
jgi:hypothetical protein